MNGPIEPVIADAAFCGKAATILPPEPWDASTWERWAAAVKQATGTKGKALFQPLRLALTGREHGPELKTAVAADRPGARRGAARRPNRLTPKLPVRCWRLLGDARLLRVAAAPLRRCGRRIGPVRRRQRRPSAGGRTCGRRAAPALLVELRLLRLRPGLPGFPGFPVTAISASGLLVGLDLGRIVFGLLAGAALHIFLAIFEGVRADRHRPCRSARWPARSRRLDCDRRRARPGPRSSIGRWWRPAPAGSYRSNS